MAAFLRLWNLLLPLCFLLSFTVAQKWDGHWYAINIRRYDSNYCWADGQPRKDTHISAKQKCVSWPGEKGFMSFGIGWLYRYKWGESPSDYGRCDLIMWESAHCEGEGVGAIYDVNTYEKNNRCADAVKKPDGSMRRYNSAAVQCRKR